MKHLLPLPDSGVVNPDQFPGAGGSRGNGMGPQIIKTLQHGEAAERAGSTDRRKPRMPRSRKGAAVVHIHSRDRVGSLTADRGDFDETVKLIHTDCDIVLEASTGGLSEMSAEERVRPTGRKVPSPSSSS